MFIVYKLSIREMMTENARQIEKLKKKHFVQEKMNKPSNHLKIVMLVLFNPRPAIFLCIYLMHHLDVE